MLAAIRAFAKSPFAIGLIALLIISFAVFGIQDVFSGPAGNAVVKVGDTSITEPEFKREFDNYKSRIEQQMGQPVPLETAVQNGLDRRVAEGLAQRLSLAELMRKIGIRPSYALISSEFQKIPAFFDPVSGRFDRRQFERVAQENGLTPDKIVSSIGDEIAERQLGTGIVAGMRMPRAYAAMAAVYMTEARDIAYLTVLPGSVPQPAAPTDTQLTAFMRENATQLTRPEFRVLTVVRFAPDQVAANVPIDPAELQKRYEFRKDTLSTPETRTLVQIPARDQATAARIVQALNAGQTPAAAAKAAGVDPILYQDKPQTAVADRKAGAAAFGLQANQVSTVQGDLGLAVVKVLGVNPGRTVTLEEARPALEAELRKDAAAERVYALTQAYEEAHQAGSNLAESAQRAGVPAITVGPLPQQGLDQQGRPMPGLSPRIAETAFALPAGGESDLVEAGNGEYFAVRVERIIPSALPALDEVRPQLTRAWTLREIARRMEARAQELAARVTKGESLEAVAASAGAPVARVANLDRATAGQRGGELGQELLASVFNAKPGEVFTARNATNGMVVGRLEAIRGGQGPMLARMAEEARGQMNAQLYREAEEAARAAAQAKMKPKVDLNRARAALGLEPVETPQGKAKK